ncbi:transcriptional repressor [Rhizocola hellebori]|uniref:Transcriptional repressor n=1 Tax=Rhizocola hellebori TaxID=1392758 RepID=A0A8J3VIA6_9ACTN|nr:transcriptional repressor [Rhizocola hellebori]GIH06836.1 transcriptional repressor [Rhizocola hellebori]
MAESLPGASRNTKQRGEILGLLRQTDDFRTAQQLYADLRSQGSGVGLTTVYRALQTLVDAGEADTMRLPSGEQLFRLCGQGRHHHHLVCRQCGRTVEIDGPAVESWTDRIAREHGFTDVSHTLEIFGTCSACAAKPE